MPQELVTSGQDYVVSQLDRSFGGREREVLRIRGRDGSVTYSTDVDIKGKLTLNGHPIGSGGSLITDTGWPLRLSAVPAGEVCLFVNGQLQHRTDYAVRNDGTVVWLSPDFSISPTDKVEAVYEA